MNQYILSLGSNLPPRETHLQNALLKISKFSTIRQIAPVFENPPLLPKDAPESWYHFFLNTAVWIESALSPQALLEHLHSIENDTGRKTQRERWSPRPLDIDIILMFSKNGELLHYRNDGLQIPHSSWTQRNFVVTPVMHLLRGAPLDASLSTLKLHRTLKAPLCAFVAILNATPDSFSEDKTSTEPLAHKMKRLLDLNPAVLDMGAESTRPGATPISAADEWTRMQPLLETWKEIRSQYPFTKLSLDTRFAETAQKALDYNVSILNDVSGLADQQMQEVATHFEQVILMHSLSIPADPRKVLSSSESPTTELKKWLEARLSQLPHVLHKKMLFDPGIGFGKTPLQSLHLLQTLNEFKAYNLPLYIGHSRKSFMNLWSTENFCDRDFETLGVSAKLFSHVEYLRIHNVEAHQRLQKSILAWEGCT